MSEGTLPILPIAEFTSQGLLPLYYHAQLAAGGSYH